MEQCETVLSSYCPVRENWAAEMEVPGHSTTPATLTDSSVHAGANVNSVPWQRGFTGGRVSVKSLQGRLTCTHLSPEDEH